MKDALRRIFNVQREELGPVLVATLFFFFVLTALMVVRPARDALGMQRGIESVRWLFMGTAVVTLMVNPVFAWLVSRYRRLHFISATYAFFASGLVGFWAVLVFAPAAIGVASGQVFYVWFSVFNLFATMVFWALLADRFTLEQSKRFFALIAAGGTLGAIFGPWLAWRLAEPFGTPFLLLLSALFLFLSIGMAWLLARSEAMQADSEASVPDKNGEAGIIGGNAWGGFKSVFCSRYLLGIAGYVMILSVVLTFLYFTRLQLVAEAGDGLDARTALLGSIDMWTQVAVLVLQLSLTGHLMKRLGVHVALALLPLTVAIGFIGLAVYGSLVVLILLEAAVRAVQRAITRPARETLYTVVNREDKYKAKAFIDTFVYRGGDVAGAQTEGLLGRLGMGLMGLASVVLPLALVWGALGIWLGREQQRKAATVAAPARRE